MKRGPDPSWLKDWRKRKRNGEHKGPTGHLKYGKFSRPVERSIAIVRPPLSDLSPAEIERLEARL